MSRDNHDDGALSHIFIDTQFAELGEITTDLLELGSGAYQLKFPVTPPNTTGLSLVVDTIVDNLISFRWDLGAAGTGGFVSGNQNNLILRAPTVLTYPYDLRLPDYSTATDVTNHVLTVTSDDRNGSVVTSWVPTTDLSNPVMTSNNTNTIKLHAPANLTYPVIYTFPNYDQGTTNLLNKVIYVASDDSAGNVTLGLSSPADLGNPKLKQGIYTMELVAGDGLTRDCILKFPDYNVNGYVNNYLKVFEDNQAGVIHIDFDPNIQTDTLKIGNHLRTFQLVAPSTQLTADLIAIPPPNLHIHGDPVDNNYKALYNKKALEVISINASGHLQLGFVQKGSIYNTTSTNTFTWLMPQSSNSYTMSVPAIQTTASKVGGMLVVDTDDGALNLGLNLQFFPKIRDTFNTTKFLSLKTNNNSFDHDVLFPAASGSSFATNEFKGRGLKVASNSSNEIFLEYSSTNIVYNSSTTSQTSLTSPDDNSLSDTFDNYELVLPYHDNTVGAGYVGKILRVKSSTGSKVELEFGTNSSISALQEIELFNSNAHHIKLKAHSTAGVSTYDLHLPSTTNSTNIGHVISISGSNSGVIDTEWSHKGDIRADNGNVLSLRAPALLTSNYTLTLPSSHTSGTKLDKVLKIASYDSGHPVLSFDDPATLALKADSSQICTVTPPTTLTASHTLILPEFATTINKAYLGDALIVSSQTTGVEQKVFLEYRSTGFLTEKINTAGTMSEGKHLLLAPATSSAGTVDAKIIFPAHTSGDNHGSKILTVANQSDYLSGGDNAAIQLTFSSAPAPIVGDQNGNSFVIAAPATINSSYDFIVPAIEAGVAGSNLVCTSSSVATGTDVLYLYDMEGVIDPTYAAAGGNGAGDTLTNTSVGAFVPDGVTVSINDRILVINCASDFKNGIYKVQSTGSPSAPWILERAIDFSNHVDVVSGTVFTVTSGSTHANKRFISSFQNFWRQSQGFVSHTNNTALSGTDTKFTTDLRVGQKIRIGSVIKQIQSITNDTSAVVTSAFADTSTFSTYFLGFRTGIDPIQFREVDSANLNDARIEFERTLSTNELKLARDRRNGTILTDTNSARATKQILNMPDIGTEDAGRRLGVSSVTTEKRGKEVAYIANLATVGGEMFYVYGAAGIVSTVGSGSNVSSVSVNDPNVAFAVAFSNANTRGSAIAPITLVSAPYGNSTSNAHYKFNPNRSGMFKITFVPKFTVLSDTNTNVRAGNLIRIALKKNTSEYPNATYVDDQTVSFPDYEIFIHDGGLTGIYANKVRKEISFYSYFVKDEQFYVELTHVVSNLGNRNGVFNLDASSSIIFQRLD